MAPPLHHLALLASIPTIALCQGDTSGSRHQAVLAPGGAGNWRSPSSSPSSSHMSMAGGEQDPHGKHDWSDLADYIRSTLTEWHITGLAVSIRDGLKNETWAEGFGYANITSKELITPHTLFFTGSTTKSFTAAALSQLIDDSAHYSNVQWTTPISQLLPGDFVLSEPWATEHVTIEDALSHRSGIPAHDMAWVPTTRELVRGLRYLPMSTEPRTTYQYSNKMYGVLGYLIEKLTGSPLGEYLYKKLWGPMGMNETFFGYHDAVASGQPLAQSYHWAETLQKHVEVPYELDPADSAAGDVVSSVLDYTTYLQTMMAEGGPISAEAHHQIKTPRILARSSWPPFTGPVFYCLAWDHAIFRGEQVWFHTGQTADFLSIMLMVPARKLSVAVFTNTGEVSFQNVAFRALYDYFGVPQDERVDFDAKMRKDKQEQKEALRTCSQRMYPSLPKPAIPPTLPLSSYTGIFEHPGYGKVFLKLECKANGDQEEPRKCKLVLTRRADAYPQLTADLVQQSGEYWLGWGRLVEYEEPEKPTMCLRAEFRIGADGSVAEFGFDLRNEGPKAPLVWFEKVA